MPDTAELIIVAAMERNASTIASLPDGAERDLYLRGLIDGLDCFVWDRL